LGGRRVRTSEEKNEQKDVACSSGHRAIHSVLLARPLRSLRPWPPAVVMSDDPAGLELALYFKNSSWLIRAQPQVKKSGPFTRLSQDANQGRLLTWLLVHPLSKSDARPASVLFDELDTGLLKSCLYLVSRVGSAAQWPVVSLKPLDRWDRYI
jgi:hypothetical protein